MPAGRQRPWYRTTTIFSEPLLVSSSFQKRHFSSNKLIAARPSGKGGGWISEGVTFTIPIDVKDWGGTGKMPVRMGIGWTQPALNRCRTCTVCVLFQSVVYRFNPYWEHFDNGNIASMCSQYRLKRYANALKRYANGASTASV